MRQWLDGRDAASPTGLGGTGMLSSGWWWPAVLLTGVMTVVCLVSAVW